MKFQFQNQYKIVERTSTNFLGFGTVHYEICFENSNFISFNHKPTAKRICAALNGAFNLGVMQGEFQNGFQND
jgi:hypothetical protein